MQRTRIAGLALALGLAALWGCAEPAPSSPVAVAPVPASPPAVAMAPGAAAPVLLVPPTPPAPMPPEQHRVAAVRHVVTVHHVVTARHWVRRYNTLAVAYSPWMPQCGSVDRPCSVQRLMAPVQ
jgi:hypothetical protein